MTDIDVAEKGEGAISSRSSLPRNQLFLRKFIQTL